MDAGLSVRLPIVPLLALLAATGCDNSEMPQPRQQNEAEAAPVNVGLPQSAAGQPGVTPMAERVAVIGLLNKRNGIVRDLVLRPGQAVRVRDAVVRLRACETTAPWETEKLTGAFVQLDVQRNDDAWERVFSGWVYKESPSLNVVEHPVYDVWPKSCAMTYPAEEGSPAAPVASSNRSSATNSGASEAPRTAPTPAPRAAPRTTPRPAPAEEPAAEPEAPPPSAPESNAT